ncbi:hypothetical protein Taro_025566 [Colocasia esculenta]|uniref:E2 ubiquitin-conjugating enzyme n=1 Tax=Colocasia esculenta TaxID=4460 RepID=A0A843VAJ3_COLES|nr:hypothetical protein [Colocasia esculenta]
MEPPPPAAVGYQTAHGAKRLWPGSTSYHDPDVVVVSSSALGSLVPNKQKHKGSQAMPHDVIVIDDDDDSAVLITGESSSNKKHKQVLLDVEDWPKDVEGFLVDDLTGYGTYDGSETGKAMETWGTTFADFLYDYADDSEDFEASPINDVIDKQWSYKEFKQFDIVKDYSDHHFSTSTAKKPSKNWSKRIQHEWKILEADLPETIFVRVYEERMDLLRAVVIGPAGTPYHDGLFFFDCYFPSSYPHTPPLVHYHSGGLRLNPNLYACGKVCLSLLGTWGGHGCEKWSSGGSTMLQVLVSIQALVLNAKPYFNEPGFAPMANTAHGESQSLAYNETTFLLSCKTMLYSLRKPPKNFEDFVPGHFSLRGRTILVACKAYMDGAQVGCVDGDGVQDVDEGDKSSSSSFKLQLKGLFDELLTELTFRGADCAEFLAQQVNTDLGIAATGAAETIPRLC